MDFNDISSYLQASENFPLLNAQQEKDLAEVIHKYKTGKKKQMAREELAISNIKLVTKMAIRYYRRLEMMSCPTIPVFDLIGAGNKGLMVAVDKYRPDLFNARFSTYAYSWIQQGITRFIHSFYNGVHVPISLADKIRRILNLEAEQENVSDEQIKKTLNISDKDLKKAREAYSRIESLDVPIKNPHGGNPLSKIDFISHKVVNLHGCGRSPFDRMADTEMLAVLEEVVAQLPDKPRAVLKKRYFSGTGEVIPLRTVGKQLGITGERVRQIEKKAIANLRGKINQKMKCGRN